MSRQRPSFRARKTGRFDLELYIGSGVVEEWKNHPYKIPGLRELQCYFVTGVITTTARKLDRELQPEHILEVSFPEILMDFFLTGFH